MRTYKRTHPWLTFQLDLRQATYRHWLLLGEVQSKCEHLSGVPLSRPTAEYLHRLYLAKGVLATTAIEGNTLTEEEVMRHLKGELQLPPSKEYLAQEIDNVVNACNRIGQRVLSNASSRLNPDDVKEFNRLVLNALPLGEGVVPGDFRAHPVGVGGYHGAPAQDCEYLTARLCDWLNDAFDSPRGYTIAFSVLKAIMAHLYIAWIHPFGDGNGRTARLVEFQILLSAGVPSNAAHLLSNHYNQTRVEYYRQLDRASKSGGDVFEFVEYALSGYVDGLREQIEAIKSQQLLVHWESYVHEQFRDKDSPSDIRRRRLVIDLTSAKQPVPVAKIRHVTPRIAEAYAGKTQKTVQRDINRLQQLGLVEKTADGVRVRTEIMRAFLPAVRNEAS